MAVELTERQQRERAYYDEYVQRLESADGVDAPFEPIESDERRPWNPYWQLFHAVEARVFDGARLLDFGCGWGTNTAVFAKMGYQVDGFDISEGNLRMARKVAEKYGLADKVNVSIQAAEALKYDDESFDVVVGVDILHHVEVASALRECRRVLKPGGVAIFREPLENPLFDTIRNTSVVRALKPNSASFETHITEDEKKLARADIETARGIFDDVKVERFRIVSRLGALVGKAEGALERVDYALRRAPGYGWLGGTIIMTMTRAR